MKQIRESRFSKIVAYYLMIMMFLQVTQPVQMYALTSGPTQPEFNSFTPIGTSDMVDLASGDFNYNIPIMDVGGYPLNLSYNSGITMDQEASWVGLGWNMNVGQIQRQVRGLPDDFNGNGAKGDIVTYDNDIKENRTVGMNLGVNVAMYGFDALNLGVGLGVESNNYEGVSFKPSFGIGFQLNDNVSVGLNFSSSLDEGASVTPSLSLSRRGKEDKNNFVNSVSGGASLGLNSRKGVENLNLSASVSKHKNDPLKKSKPELHNRDGIGGSISFNNLSFTPSKRIGFQNSNFSFNGALGGEVFGVEGQVQVTGYGSYQKINPEYKHRNERAYGYENTEYKGSRSGVLDFNRENEKTVNHHTAALPVTNYTYDLYSIEGQGVSGMFRPYRSKVGNVYDDYVTDNGRSNNFGIEIGLGNLVHASGDFKMAPSTSWTGPWIQNNNVLPYLKESHTDANKLEYEPHTFKMVGGMTVDPDTSTALQNTKALRVGITGSNKNSATVPTYYGNDGNNGALTEIKRKTRYARSQVVYKVTNKEAKQDSLIVRNDTLADKHPHHTAGIKVLQTDGSLYVFGNAAYNIKKVEATFDVSKESLTVDKDKGLVSYLGVNGVIGGNSSATSDMFLNKITTPAYVHSYMLSSVLSSDYEDSDAIPGPSINDLGSYTQFKYTTPYNYKWRVPFEANKATYNEGLNSKKDDQKGNYLYGEKQLTYIDRIVTKTHVAFFDLQNREDAIAANGEEGGAGTVRMKSIKSIRLYSLAEVTSNGVITDPTASGAVKPIKTAYFEYDYSLCPGMPNSTAAVTHGKLTLKKVYFTYRGSNMGKYTPYVFDYNASDANYNPNYHPKGFDIWGNYKPALGDVNVIGTVPTTTEFPFADQGRTKAIADQQASVWTLAKIQLPSGGEIKIDTESDDYQFVQNKKAMQMFQVLGAGSSPLPTAQELANTTLYNGSNHNKYLYVKLDSSAVSQISNLSNDVQKNQWFKDRYLAENLNKPIQFKFMLNMRNNNLQHEYVSGYFKIDESGQHKIHVANSGSGPIAILPLQFLTRDKSGHANPIAKAGWGFGRTYLNRIVYGNTDNPSQRNFTALVESLKGSMSMIKELFVGPNGYLQDKGQASRFNPAKSWVRLENPNGKKVGGGLRVSSIKLSDNWENMLYGSSAGTDVAAMEYGQTYSYDDGSTAKKSSGVATFEPNSCAENPFVEPMYNNSTTYAEKVAAPKESNYSEKPFGENFFPAAKVTYSRVTVKNIKPTHPNSTLSIKKHATGSVVTQHYTSYDFPTRVEFTPIGMINDLVGNNIIGSLIKMGNINVRNHLTMAQGYAIETNDMNGKVEQQTVYDEDQNEISSVEYKYNADSKGKLDNNLTTIDSKGIVDKKLIGQDSDMVHDFNESFSETTTMGFDVNTATFLVAVLPIFVPAVFPKRSHNENKLRTAVTTKHIHKTGILVEKIAKDLGAKVSTKNLAWDAGSGEVILTGTVNEYGDKYYSFTYPAYWMYKGMGLASTNIGIHGELQRINNCTFDPRPYYRVFNPKNKTAILNDLDKYFQPGDEIQLEAKNTGAMVKAWVIALDDTKTGLLLMDKAGHYIDECGSDDDKYNFKVVRSGYRNLQSASMASVTSMINPIDVDGDSELPGGEYNNITASSFVFTGGSGFNPRVVNSSAVEYKDFWKPQGDTPYHYPTLPGLTPDNSGEVMHPYDTNYNPYVWNTKGDWKAEKSYAYLTGRKAAGTVNNPRNEGFYTKFTPFYVLDNTGAWTSVKASWTAASSVTQFSPYGMELENKDALDRYSSAQYGYQNKLPMAVASNARYNEIGFEGFEETQNNPAKHFLFNGLNNGTPVPVTIEHNEWHTGKRSVKVTTSSPVSMVRKMKPAVTTAQPRVCSYNCEEIIKIEFVGTNVPVGGCSYIDPTTVYTKYKLSTKCLISLPVSDGGGGASAVSPYEFTPVPGEPNNVYITFYRYVEPENVPDENTSVITRQLVPVKIDGVPMNLLYIFAYRNLSNNGNHCYIRGLLECP
jgi:hypothetical protein